MENGNNDDISISQSRRPITPPSFSVEQNKILMSLWLTHSRTLLDVPITADDADTASPPFTVDTYNIMARLYGFILAYLEANINLVSQSSMHEDALNNFANKNCLRPFAQLALSSIRTRNNSCEQSYTIKKVVRLLEGRHVLNLHHEDFMNELNLFENGGTNPSEEFIQIRSFGSFLYFFPHWALPAFGCSVALAMITLFERQQQQALLTDRDNNSPTVLRPDKVIINRFIERTQIIIKFINVYPQIQMTDIKTGLNGKFVSLKGHVVKVRPKRLRLATADFKCNTCGAIISHSFSDGKYSFPVKCFSSNRSTTPSASGDVDTAKKSTPCRSKTFTFVRPTARYVNVQEIRLQEIQDEDHNAANMMQAGRTPKQIEVELVHSELVNMCRPGDIVLVAGTVAAINTAVAAGSKGRKTVQETSTYKLYVVGHSITTMSESNESHKKRKANSSNPQQHTKFTQQQLRSIVQLCHADHKCFSLVERRAFPFDLLVRSLCPSIIGHHAVKAGLLLCLLGGTPSGATQSSSMVEKGNSIRSNSHILIVGDPGMGKSQMLLAATQLAARSVYVGGNTSSTTGLTVSLTKEERGETGIEAGALVLADQGICAIDEFDKMAKNHQDGLLEAMEQQQVSIAKAGVVASLPARCSVIAAANPKHGSYDMSRTVAENLNMAKPILSRFDLVFILRDRADKELDRLVSSNIMNLYRSSEKRNIYSSADLDHSIQGERMNNHVESAVANEGEIPTLTCHKDTDKMPISKRLAWVCEIQKEPLPADLVRDYIAYAREYCKPKMTAEAATVLKDYYMELRYPSDGKRKRDTVPITTRQLEALIRLCQARAKAALREFVLREDALDVIELMTISVNDVHRDEEGSVDPHRGGAGGTSNRKMKKAFLNELHRLYGGSGGEFTIDDMRRLADIVGCGLYEFQPTIDNLRENGILMQKGHGKYQLLS